MKRYDVPSGSATTTTGTEPMQFTTFAGGGMKHDDCILMLLFTSFRTPTRSETSTVQPYDTWHLASLVFTALQNVFA